MNSDSAIPLRPKRARDAAPFHCPTCSDEGLPARVLRVDEATDIATVRMENGEQEVALDLLDGVQAGDYVLVHLSTAIARLAASDVVEDESRP